MEKKAVYLDHAAATPLLPEVLKKMMPFLTDQFGNPSALYGLGVAAHDAVENSREKVAQVLGAVPENIIFTSGGTESNNLAILGVARAHAGSGNHVIAIGIEHSSVLEPLKELTKQGFEITYVPVDRSGLVSAEAVLAALKPETILVTVLYANNEIGSIEPIADIGRVILKYRQHNKTHYPYFHTDACQAGNYLDLNVERLHVDLMTLNGSKIYGPKGSGCLYVRRGVKLEKLVHGGGQERNFRSGTENVAGIVGFAEALSKVQSEREKETERLQKLSAYFWEELYRLLPEAVLNGPMFGINRLPNNVHVTLPGVEGERLVLYLGETGVSCSAASACASEKGETSHVLQAIGISETNANQSVRFTLGRGTTKSVVEHVVGVIARLHKKLFNHAF